MNSISHYLFLARKEAKKSNHPDHQVGCVIVHKNKVIGRGYNSTKTHPKSNSFYRHIHAEMAAMLNARTLDFPSKCTIYVFREHKDGCWALSKPCQYCSKLIKDAGIKNIVYTANNGWVIHHDRRTMA